jgi:hypothetical protein
MDDVTKEVLNNSILGFTLNNGIVNEKGELLDFSDRRFMVDILTDMTPNQVIKKCAQIGGSVTFTLKTLWAPKYRGWSIIYTFPTDDDVREFVGTKVNKIIQSNPQVFGDLQTDNIERKQIGDNFVFYKGTISKTAAISTTADLLVHDEADRSDQKTLETYQSRLKGKKAFKGTWVFSNPTTEKGIVDNMWQRSDQKEWNITCSHCHSEQVLTWPDSVNIAANIYQCKDCKRELSDFDRRWGRWVAGRPDQAYDAVTNPLGVSGYHISLLMAPWVPAREIVNDSQGDQEYFYNFILGEPYNPGDLRVTRSTILDNWTPKDLTEDQYYLGVDVGNVKHYALGSSKGLIKVGRFSAWSDLDAMIKMYKPIMVIDAMPDNTMSKYYVANHQQAYMSFFQENKNNPKQIVWWGEGVRQGIVYSNRNRIIDQLINEIINGRILFGLASDKELSEFVKHYETLRRIKVVDPKGIESFVWESTTGVDHYVFATLYYYLATLTRGSGAVFSRGIPSSVPLVKDSLKDGQLLNIGEVLKQQGEMYD